jgi:hypothetical protein
MTEEEWLTATDPAPMLEWLRGRASERKLRLFACACCWDTSHSLWSKFGNQAVSVAARFAEGVAIVDELESIRAAIYQELRPNMYGDEPVWDPTWWACDPTIDRGAVGCAFYASNRGVGLPLDLPDYDSEFERVHSIERQFQADLLRELFGNPFRPITLDPAWLTSTVVALARGIYDEKAFDRMPILADALQDAGCEDEAILTHCRDEKGVHVRGCWVVDLVLGKA